MATVKGQNLRIFIGGVAVAAAQSCTLQVQTTVEQQSTKDDTGDFAKNTVVRLSWNVQANGLVTVDPDRNDPATMLDRIGQTVQVELATASGEQNSEIGDALLAGEAIISDVQIEAQNQQDSTYSIQLTGKRDMLTDIRLILTGDEHYIRTASGNLVAAAQEE